MSGAKGKQRTVAFFIPHLGCPHRCSFCDQRAITGQAAIPSPEEVEETLEQAARTHFRWQRSEIGFFGGSFTAVDRCITQPLLETASRFVRQGLFQAIRISTRPDAVDRQTLEWLKSYGVSMVELGAQSMDDRVLVRNERGHTAAQIRVASRLIQEAGLSLGLQMMTGLCGDDVAGAIATAEEFCRLCPETVRIYPTVVLRGTALCRLYEKGLYHPQDLDQAAELCARLLCLFERHRIRVIRLGLHDSPQLRENYVAGPWHPAFGEMCEAYVWRRNLERALCQRPKGRYLVFAAPAQQSRVIGQHRANIIYFQQHGYSLRVTQDAALDGREMIVRKEETVCC